MEEVSLVIWDLTSFKAVQNSVLVDCWVWTNCVTISPIFSYMEVDKVVGLDSLDLMDTLIGVHRKSLRTLILKRRGWI